MTNRMTDLHNGNVIADGHSHEVKVNPLVRETYLGTGLETA